QDIDKLIDLFTRPAFIAYASILVFVTIILIVVIKSVERSLASMRDVIRASSEMTLSRRDSRRSIGIDRTPTSASVPEVLLRRSQSATSLSVSAMDGIPAQPHATVSGASGAFRRRPTFVIETTSDFIISPRPISSTDDCADERGRLPLVPPAPYSASPPTSAGVMPEEEGEEAPLLGRPTGLVRAFKRGHLASLVGILYAVVGGMVASMTLLLTKGGVELALASLFSSASQAHGVFSLIIVLLLVITAIGQVYSLNAALKYELPVIVLPIFFTLFTCLSLANTMVYVNGFGVATAADFSLLILGLAFLVAGVFMLGRKDSPGESPAVSQA
ncbi:hypothetical protein HDU91_002587, partial [Kappamyces sp. JEL0680]